VTHPAVDVLTDRVAVVLQDRPVVSLGTWLTDVIRICGLNGKGFQLVTPVASRLTVPLFAALDGPDTRWVARDDEAGTYHDGISGRQLGWDGTRFTTGSESAPFGPGFVGDGDARPGAWHLTLTVQLRHAAADRLQLGGVVEELFASLAGGPPAGWGTAEPATQRWSRSALTALARERAPRRTWLFIAGPTGEGASRALGTLLVARKPSGVLETLQLTVADPEPRDPAGLLAAVGPVLNRYPLRFAAAHQRPGLPDLTHLPRWTGLPAPAVLMVGAEALAGRPPGGLRDVGALDVRTFREAVGYQLGEVGEDPAQGWRRLEQVVAHLNSPWLATDASRPWGHRETAVEEPAPPGDH